MRIHKAYKFRLYPTKEQQILIAKTSGCSRFVFNHFLSEWNNVYKRAVKGLSYGTCSAGLPAFKKDLATKGFPQTGAETDERTENPFQAYGTGQKGGTQAFRIEKLSEAACQGRQDP